ncbi:MAG: hypothetical protein BWY06_01617 [Candidatus Latescibacteria bacterium ADurb.Bin168]|nr:MAG: hypothetical protein BWY06_01617 [Candidatus Latescibacteria bacterium ADurb.Bin168]
MHRGNDCREIVIRKHHIAGFFCHVSSGDPHCHADFGPFQGRSIVHAVARHRYDVPAGLQCIDDLEFVLRRYAGVHGGSAHGLAQRCFVQLVYFQSRQSVRVFSYDAKIGGDTGGRLGVISRNHNDADARTVGFHHRFCRFRAGGIQDADDSHVHKIRLKRLVHRRTFLGRDHPVAFKIPICDRDGSERLRRKCFDIRHACRTARVVERYRLVAHKDVRAPFKQHIRGSFGEQRQAPVVPFAQQNGHALAFGRERDLPEAFVALHDLLRATQLPCCHDKRGLGRVPLNLPDTVPLAKGCVSSEAATGEHPLCLRPQRRIADLLAGDFSPAGRIVPNPGQLHLSGSRDDLRDRHFAFCQRAGFVRTYYRGGAERLCGRQFLHNRVSSRHALHADCQNHR